MWNRLLIVLFISLLMDEANPKGWGGFGGRGGGGFGGRGGGGGYRPPVRPPRPGPRVPSRPRVPGGRGWGPMPARQSWGRPGTFGRFGGFRSGSGLGSRSSSSSFLSSLAGGALGAMGGMLMFEAGRAIIQSMGSPFRYGGRDYYFDNHPGVGRDQIQCSIPLDELKQLSKDQGKRSAENISTSTTSLPTISTSPPKMSPGELLDNLRYKNGSSPKVFTWACRREVEQCCGTECCPVESKMKTIGIVIAIVAVVLLALLCCCCLCPMLSKGGFTGGAGGQQPPGSPYGGSPYPHDVYYYPDQATPGYSPYPQPYEGYPVPQYPPGAYPPYGNNPQYYPPEGYPYPPYPPEGYPPQGVPQEGYPPRRPSAESQDDQDQSQSTPFNPSAEHSRRREIPIKPIERDREQSQSQSVPSSRHPEGRDRPPERTNRAGKEQNSKGK